MSQTGENRWPREPPNRTATEYIQNRKHVDDVKAYCRSHPLECFRTSREWANGGSVRIWVEKEGPDRCIHKRALVRGDGKIMSLIDMHEGDCNLYTDFAKEVNGQLRGVTAEGMYEYK